MDNERVVATNVYETKEKVNAFKEIISLNAIKEKGLTGKSFVR